MLGYLITGIILVVLGFSPVYTPISLWWLFLGVSIILLGVVFIIHSFSIKGCWERIFEGEPEAMKLLEDEVNKAMNGNE